MAYDDWIALRLVWVLSCLVCVWGGCSSEISDETGEEPSAAADVQENGELSEEEVGIQTDVSAGDDATIDETESFEWARVEVGNHHTCAIANDGSLWCWGGGRRGLLGTGDADASASSPVRVGEESTWESLSTSHEHTCAIREDATLWCWGAGWGGQLGVDDDTDRPVPTQVGEEQWNAVTTGGGRQGTSFTQPEGFAHTCGIRDDATLWCWGSGFYGQLGHGTADDELTPRQVGGESNWTKVAAGEVHTCAVRDDATLWCWGAINDSSAPKQMGDESDWQVVSAGRSQVCGVRSDNHLWCWTDDDTAVRQVAEGWTWSDVSVGNKSICAVSTDSTLWCWGSGDSGRLGVGDVQDREEPTQVGDRDEWDTLSATARHGCAIDDHGDLWCWGGNLSGGLGHGEYGGGRSIPTPLDTDRGVADVSAAWQYGCLVATDGTLWCWGRRTSYLTRDIAPDRASPEQVGSDTDWKTVSTGAEHVCAVRDSGTLWCWGRGQYGRLGLGNTENLLSPHQVGDATDWRSVSSGRLHTCAVREDDTLWCWGSSGLGQLGHEDGNWRNTPAQVGEASDWKSVSAGGSASSADTHHTCGVRRNGSLWCWGNGAFGRLGTGNTQHQSTPTRVGESFDWIVVSAGSNHTCAVRENGTLWCWGRNYFGQLGVGDTSDYSDPRRVGEDSNWTTVSAGKQYTCGVQDDGTVWCWGPGSKAGRGDADPTLPAQVGDGDDWVSVSAGGSHTHGIQTDDTGWSWGSNGAGRLGDGTAWKTEPVRVAKPE